VVRSGKRRFYSGTALSLVDSTGIADPVGAIEHLTKQLLDDCEVTQAPVPLKMLASFCGAADVQVGDIKESGRLTPLKEGGYRIEIRASDPQGRRSFSFAHEIGHLLMPNYQIHPVPKVDACTGEFSLQNEEEYFCDMAAANLLLPDTILRRRCSEIAPSIDALIGLANEFEASIEAVALRVDHLSAWDCTPVVWEMALKPSQRQSEDQTSLFGSDEVPPPAEEFRVKFHAGRQGAFFPVAKHVPMDCEMVQCCLTEGVYRGRCVIPTSESDMHCYAEAKLVHYRNEKGEVSQRIVSLVFPQ